MKTRANQVDVTEIAETPRASYFGPDQTLTQVFRDAEAAENFAEDNMMRRGRPPKVSDRDNTRLIQCIHRTGPTI